MRETRHRKVVDGNTSIPLRRSPRFDVGKSQKKPRSPLRRSPRFCQWNPAVDVVKKPNSLLRKSPRYHNGKALSEPEKKSRIPLRRSPRFHGGIGNSVTTSANNQDTSVVSDAKECCIAEEMGDSNCGMKNTSEDGRHEDQNQGNFEVCNGWTEEQELALRRAYFTAKPTPNFWKKVARMVSGKSAEECFDRIHSDLLSLSQPPVRSREKTKKSVSPPSFSASMLLSPAEKKSRKHKTRRTSRLQSHKTVRHLLEKQKDEDEGHEADLFAVLEPTIDPVSLYFLENIVFVSPKRIQKFSRCSEASISPAHKKHVDIEKEDFVSPPVLKQIKDKALHEKYIDQLHCRDSKRKAEWMRNAKNEKKGGKQSDDAEVNPVKVARDALVVDAQSAISQFRILQATEGENDDDEHMCYMTEDEGEFV